MLSLGFYGRGIVEAEEGAYCHQQHFIMLNWHTPSVLLACRNWQVQEVKETEKRERKPFASVAHDAPHKQKVVQKLIS